jgi:FxsC-like protein
MNERRFSRAEKAAYDLLCPSVPGELSNLCVRMEFAHTPGERESPAETIRKLWYFCKDTRGGTALADLEFEIYEMRPNLPKPHNLVYLNCSDRERKDQYSWQFFRDLMEALGPDYPNRELRYFDEGSSTEVRAWNPWALRAMREAQVMLCLYTKDFFLQAYCGQVWRAFREGSAHEQRAQGAAAAPLILPILWAAPEEYLTNLPRVARELAFPHETLGAEYRKHGLFYLMRRGNRKDAESVRPYEEFLANCAGHLRDLLRGATSQTLRDTTSLDQIPSDFAGLARDPESAPQLGVDSPKFIYLSARKHEIEPVRNPEPYGASRDSWAPYHPSRKDQIERVSKEAAWEQSLAPQELLLDDAFVPNLQKAHQEGSFILIIVDPWTMWLEEYRLYASKYDAVNLPGSTLLICLNPEDRETQTTQGTLRARVRTAFPNKFHRDSPEHFRPEALSMTSLRSKLSEVLTTARSRAVAEAPDVRSAEGRPYVRPVIVPDLPAGTAPAPPARTAAPAESAPISLPRLAGPITGGER